MKGLSVRQELSPRQGLGATPSPMASPTPPNVARADRILGEARRFRSGFFLGSIVADTAHRLWATLIPGNVTPPETRTAGQRNDGRPSCFLS